MNALGMRIGKKRRSRRRFDDIPNCASSSQYSTYREGLEGKDADTPRRNLEEDIIFQSNEQECISRDQCQSRARNVPSEPMPLSSLYNKNDEEELSDGFISPQDDSLPSHEEILQSPSVRNSLDTEEQLIPTKINNWRVIWALVLTNGSQRISKETYKSVRNLAESFNRTREFSWKSGSFIRQNGSHDVGLCEATSFGFLPHYSTLQKTYRPYVLGNLAPRSVDFNENVNSSAAGVTGNVSVNRDERKSAVRCIVPSEYARSDVATPTLWSAMVSTSLSTPHYDYRSYCVDTVPVVAARELYYGRRQSMSVDNADPRDAHASFAEVGDIVWVSLFQSVNLTEQMLRCFGYNISPSGCFTLRGIVTHTFNVHHSSRCGDSAFANDSASDLSSRDENSARLLGYRSYTSPIDHVTIAIPDLPAAEEDESSNLCLETSTPHQPQKKRRTSPEQSAAMKRRRANIKQRNLQLEEAWAHWEKPPLKPGDFVTMLRPASTTAFESPATLLTQVDKDSILFIVHRFWVEQEEKSCHILWLSGGQTMQEASEPYCDAPFHLILSPLFQNSRTLHTDVHSPTLISKHEGKRGPEKIEPISSVGVLDIGEHYFIYRFLLFWDGFQLFSGKQASGDGIYMLNLNLPLKARSSPSAVRILSLIPPGFKTADVLNRILPDVVKGTTEGFVDVDADGTRRRIFLNLVGVLGDTPALNSTLDVLGHTATACCHLCRYARVSSTLTGSRYSVPGSHGLHSAFSRGFFQHIAMKDCDPSHETCRLLGMKKICRTIFCRCTLFEKASLTSDIKLRLQKVESL